MLLILKTIFFLFISSLAFAKPGASFEVTLSPAGDFTGKVTKVEGFATETDGKIKAENIKVDLNDLSTGITLRDTHTKKYLDVPTHPYANLISAEGENGKGKGVIEIRGVQKEVKGTYSIVGSELVSVFKINLPDFNITGIAYKGIGVDDEVTIKVTVPLKRTTGDAKPAKTQGKKKQKKK